MDLGWRKVHMLRLALLSPRVYEERLLLVVRVRPVLLRLWLRGMVVAAAGDVGRWVQEGALAVGEEWRDLGGCC